ncbi:HAD superfamily hydrolase (TIGR01509 family) [Catenulispora sp. EB89]|uniref:HAD family hydrolase n=1 Tax=Catenulispora sp. EB89 TaxID=3156257 RepID=UPI00351448AD
MSSPLELVIFDCDGTLVDSETLALDVVLQLGREMGWPLTATEVVDLFMGKSVASQSVFIDERLGEGASKAWHTRFRELHDAAVAAELTAIDGIPEALDAIALPKCIASSNGHRQIGEMLAMTGLAHHFGDRISTAAEVAHGKPAPDVFLLAAERQGVNPAACIVVEDSRFGAQAARAAGMRCLAYTAGLTPADRFDGLGAVLLDDMRKLPELIAAA